MLFKLWITSFVTVTLGFGVGVILCTAFKNFPLGEIFVALMWISYFVHITVGAVVATWLKW
jgi:hypothetical protein